ncbi:unnamed protein product [Linum tenue]|uniref:F-box domain-containing protein n=2 Tax=Linum tenue TaxID=586396 RepID=A0AAV0LSE1_9ROSI|nr:unnamed protein product [Linum tenue]CAI0436421.1 unnamed protein product [Linum tenue]
MSADNSTSASDRPPSSRFVPCGSGKRCRIPSTEPNPPPKIRTLGDDLLVEILIRLPNPRYSCRCKAVCKGWRSLISSPRFNRSFISRHRSRNQPSSLLLTSDDSQSIINSFLPRMSFVAQISFSVLDSYKDLVLCGFYSYNSSDWYRLYFICNPLTEQWAALPLAPELAANCLPMCTRLVCESRISNNLDLGDDQVFVYSSEHRFRVVSVYREDRFSLKLNVFCSESREWTKEALVIDDRFARSPNNMLSCNGELFWLDLVQDPGPIPLFKPVVFAFDPFRPDIPPSAIDAPSGGVKLDLHISVSQGAVHVFLREKNPDLGLSPFALTVWRLEEDRKTWRKLCAGLVKGSRSHEMDSCGPPTLHPGKPEVVFFTRRCNISFPPQFTSVKMKTHDVLSCNLKTGGELELFADVHNYPSFWRLFQAEFSCWPTSIPKYEELRVAYDGSHSCWAQNDNTPVTPP